MTTNLIACSAQLESILQSISIVVFMYTLYLPLFFGIPFTTLVLLYGSRWMQICIVVYLVYIYNDRDTHCRGGRSWKLIEKVRHWRFWKHCANHFPIKLIKTADLDPSRNYIFCGFPHGLYGFGFATSFQVNGNGCDDMFPGLEFRLLTFNLFFFIPFLRDFILMLGFCSCSKESMDWLLSTKPRTKNQGRALVLLVGGRTECFNTSTDVYQVVLKCRKGFVRLALKNGAPLVPVFSFGEIDYYNIVQYPEGSFRMKIRNFLISKFGIPVFLNIEGEGLQNWFGLKPKRKPVHVVVGSPIKVPTIENPSEDEVDKYHQIFIEKLTELFDSYKNTFSEMYSYGNLTLSIT